MQKNRNPHLRLIIDSDQAFLEALKAEASTLGQTILAVNNGKNAQLLLADPAQSIFGIFVNMNLPSGFGLSIIRFAHRYRPATPIYILLDPGSEGFSDKDLSRLGIQNVIKKPVTFRQILASPNQPSIQFDPTLALDLAQRNADASDQVEGVEDTAFVPILAEHFLSGSTSFFDIYLKLASGKYIKILRAGDSFTVDRVTNYINKGIVSFYLRREAQENYLNYCDKLTNSLIHSEKAPAKLQINHTLNHGHEVMRFLETNGVNYASLHYANEFVGNVKTLVAKNRPKNNEYLDEFLSNVASFEHGVGVTIIASMLASHLGMTSSNPAQLVGMAALLHDIGLLQYKDIKDLDEDESKMSESQIITFHTHPIIGADILRSFRRTEPTAIQAVAQHHERRNQKGFPNKLGGGSINKVSEIIGIADDFMKLLQKQKLGAKLDPIEEIQKTISTDFSFSVGEAFRKVFVIKKAA
ncbi:MAG: HD domain-containing protein [Bdellovibrio sp.]|nr:HD domain-containing protein [Bdellovibrio sp.]